VAKGPGPWGGRSGCYAAPGPDPSGLLRRRGGRARSCVCGGKDSLLEALPCEALHALAQEVVVAM